MAPTIGYQLLLLPLLPPLLPLPPLLLSMRCLFPPPSLFTYFRVRISRSPPLQFFIALLFSCFALCFFLPSSVFPSFLPPRSQSGVNGFLLLQRLFVAQRPSPSLPVFVSPPLYPSFNIILAEFFALASWEESLSSAGFPCSSSFLFAASTQVIGHSSIRPPPLPFVRLFPEVTYFPLLSYTFAGLPFPKRIPPASQLPGFAVIRRSDFAPGWLHLPRRSGTEVH